MADDVTFTVAADATPPGGTVAATDETSFGPHAAGAHMGIAKLAVSANGDSTHVPATAADGLLVEVSNAGSITFGGLTDAELRASPVDVDVASALPAGNNNIGDVDVASVPAPLSTTGGGTEAAALRVTIANNSTGLVSVDDNGGSLTVDGPLTDAELRATPVSVSGTVATGGLTDAQLRATPVPVSGTVTSNAGTNLNTSLLALEAGGNLAAAAASLSVMDDWDETDRAKVNIIAGQVGVAGGSGTDSALTQRVSLATNVALPAGTNNIGDVDVLTLPAIPAGNNNIGDVDIASLPNEGQQNMAGSISVAIASDQSALTVAQATAANLNAQVVGTAAHASPTSGNPVYIAGRASNAVPTDVGADGDAAGIWLNRNGAQVVAMAPHTGLTGSPWSLTGETAQYTTTQTSTVLVAGGASERLVVTKVQIQVGGTTAGTLQLYFGTGAYSRGTNLAIFDGEFAPSATLKPGVIMDGPFISAANGDDLLVTDSAAINPLTITVWYYVLT